MRRNNYKSFGFTLAETLIALGIIGIVAAITIPTLFRHFREIVYSAKCKKFQAVMTNAIKLSVDEKGDISSWNKVKVGAYVAAQQNSEAIAKNIISYLKVSEDCGFKPNCMLVVDYKNPDGSKWNTYTNYRDKLFYKIILMDGSHVIVKAQGDNCNMPDGGYQNTCGYMIFDVNGSAPPNQFNKDAFVFEILKDSVVPKKW